MKVAMPGRSTLTILQQPAGISTLCLWETREHPPRRSYRVKLARVFPRHTQSQFRVPFQNKTAVANHCSLRTLHTDTHRHTRHLVSCIQDLAIPLDVPPASLAPQTPMGCRSATAATRQEHKPCCNLCQNRLLLLLLPLLLLLLQARQAMTDSVSAANTGTLLLLEELLVHPVAPVS